jgi:hypothetical protein
VPFNARISEVGRGEFILDHHSVASRPSLV